MTRLMTALVLGVFVITPGIAAEARTPESKDRMICESTMTTGSHIRQRSCTTESERKARRLRDQQRASELQNREFKTSVKSP